LVLVAAIVVALLASACAGDDRSDAGVASTTTTAKDRDVRASEGCGSQALAVAPEESSGDTPSIFDSGGQTRRYRLGVPDSYDPNTPTPVILNLHGAGSNADQQSVYSQMPARGTERGYIVVTPDAVASMWELQGQGSDDEFLTALLDDIGTRYCVDLDRVHATGISLGSWKATITACTHPERFASLALVAEEVAPQGCALPVVAFHGTADFVVPYGAGADPGVQVSGVNAGLTGVEVNMPTWARNNGCSEDKDVVRIEPDVSHWMFRDCPEGTGVELYSIDHGGHTWPGSPIALAGTTKTIDATGIALDWFDAHPRTARG
jgi:polyhydroxybutyrate depolymerase